MCPFARHRGGTIPLRDHRWLLVLAFLTLSEALSIPLISKGSIRKTSMLHKGVPPPQSCDTFVVVGKSATIFGKNSDRPDSEVHEVVRFASADHSEGSKLKCQYIEIPQAKHTYSVVLSRPAWLWGAEMGSNECGLCAGNEAVFSRDSAAADDGVKRLLGMDIVRLVLERAATAKEAVEVAGSLMETHGQGGPCEDGGSWCYENAFLFADHTEAWIFETAGVSWWVAERVPKGKYRNISNGLTIRNPDLTHSGFLAAAKDKGWWDGKGSFDWKLVMLGGGYAADELEPEGREAAGLEWLQKLAGKDGAEREFGFEEMATILRDKRSGICMTGGFSSTGSQISIMSQEGGKGDIHWFTTNSNPSVGCYKPFAFGPGGAVGATDKAPSTKQLWLTYDKAGLSKVGALQDKLRGCEATLCAQAMQAGASPDMFDQAVAEEMSFFG